jgi:L-histidine Nalpha-methyltransferase
VAENPHYPAPSKMLLRDFRQALQRPEGTIVGGKSDTESLLDFARATAAGLASSPRTLQCRFLYDARGSDLFERITRQPEYYLTATEAGILARHAPEIRQAAGPTALVELGSGTSVKTGFLLRAWLARGPAVRYIPIDVSLAALREASRRISGTLPAVQTIAVHADYHEALPLFQLASPVLVVFLGSSIGNLGPKEMDAFFSSLAPALSAKDSILLGIDLVKDANLIEAAYNDAAGITALFTLNLFARMNRELGSGIDLSALEHLAHYHQEREQVETFVRFTRDQTIRIAPLNKSFLVNAGDSILVETSRKFRVAEFVSYAARFGFSADAIYTDEKNWFALFLLRRCAPS